jgi:hypothetical protein
MLDHHRIRLEERASVRRASVGAEAAPVSTEAAAIASNASSTKTGLLIGGAIAVLYVVSRMMMGNSAAHMEPLP